MAIVSLYMFVFRIVHILAGTVWVGGVGLVVMYIQPSAASLGPAAGPMVQELLSRRKLPTFLVTVGALTVGAGVFVYWRDWQDYGSLGNFVGHSFGLSLTIGAIAGIIALLVGAFGVKPTLDRLLPMAAQLAAAGAAGNPPAPGRAEELGSLQQRARQLSRLVFALQVVAVIAMATARYW